ncbi:hypothetical protein CLOM_g13434 [Closterium sp. NIES-68]|nr:hypothetical protein CLOM_g13434 [Closterium sp. NIES-68]GJP72449.1 hypothetical protein CLOP_g3181 [Closterium sp. NIES-67]
MRRSLDMDAARAAERQPESVSNDRSASGRLLPVARRQAVFTFAPHSAAGSSSSSGCSPAQPPNQPPSPADQIRAWREASRNSGVPTSSKAAAAAGGAIKAPRPSFSAPFKGSSGNAIFHSPQVLEAQTKQVPAAQLYGGPMHSDALGDLYPDPLTNQSFAASDQSSVANEVVRGFRRHHSDPGGRQYCQDSASVCSILRSSSLPLIGDDGKTPASNPAASASVAVGMAQRVQGRSLPLEVEDRQGPQQVRPVRRVTFNKLVEVRVVPAFSSDRSRY